MLSVEVADIMGIYLTDLLLLYKLGELECLLDKPLHLHALFRIC